MEQRTHLGIDASLVGKVTELSEGEAVVRLTTTSAMAADDHGLVHGGFMFGLADYAAMLSINEPTVVLAGSESRFLKPVKVGEELIAKAKVKRKDGKKRWVRTYVYRGEEAVLEAEFFCIIPATHVLGE